MSPLEQVRQALLTLKNATAAELEVHLSIATYDGRRRLQQRLRDLVKSGEAARSKGRYVLLNSTLGGSVQQKIWRAAVLKSQKGYFSPADLAQLVQGRKDPAVSRDYVRRYCRWLAAQKFLLEVTRHRGAPIYLVIADKEKEPAPHWNRRAERREKQLPVAGSQLPVKESDCTAKILQEMEVAVAGLVNGVTLLTDVFQDLRTAVGLQAGGDGRPTGERHEPEDRG